MRIVFLGASLTEGVYGGNFVRGVAERMPEHEIINMGVGGSTMNRLLERLDDAIATQPDAVLIMAGSNDAIAYSQPLTRPYYKSAQNLPNGYLTPAEFGQMFRELIERLQLAFIRPLIGLPPLEYNPTIAEASQLFNTIVTDESRAHKVPILDLNPALMPESIPDRPPLDLKMIFLIGDRVQSGWKDYEREREQGGYTYSFDGIHFTEATATRVADLLTDFLRAELG
ncbi:MAG: GDSL-type esterase/lipase family protein [Anaerolineae bacterium]|nr:GDSL-type esterase/lipase family protein [Anaerolineae bacterium]